MKERSLVTIEGAVPTGAHATHARARATHATVGSPRPRWIGGGHSASGSLQRGAWACCSHLLRLYIPSAPIHTPPAQMHTSAAIPTSSCDSHIPLYSHCLLLWHPSCCVHLGLILYPWFALRRVSPTLLVGLNPYPPGSPSPPDRVNPNPNPNTSGGSG